MGAISRQMANQTTPLITDKSHGITHISNPHLCPSSTTPKFALCAFFHFRRLLQPLAPIISHPARRVRVTAASDLSLASHYYYYYSFFLP
jgi:hypothetical protein